MKRLVLTGLSVLLAAGAPGAHAQAPQLSKEMNEISFEKYRDFQKKWHLVTVRYRKDTEEMRLTYANDIAFAAVNKFNPVFPEGSVFAKIGLKTGPDPAFPSSAVPSGTRRYQFMVKNAKKYKETDGWGYALFNGDGVANIANVHNDSIACAACHKIVADRDFVFSQPMVLDAGVNAFAYGKTKHAQFRFEKREIAKFAPTLAKQFQSPGDSVSSLEGPLREHAFPGTFDEVVPLLLDQSMKGAVQKAALYIDEKNFTLSESIADATGCDGRRRFRIVIMLGGRISRDTKICQ